jgi:hypothetical protein
MSTSLAMLTQVEQTLHHNSAMVKKKLEAYHASESKDARYWWNEFRAILVYRHLLNHSCSHAEFILEGFCKLFADTEKKCQGEGRPCPRVHPLLVSLAAAFNQGDSAPNISSVSEDDPRVVRGNYYTPPDNLPPLEIHFDGQNGEVQL